MKILHLSSQDNGGAGRAAVRLHKALLDNNINSQMIVQTKTTDLPTIHSLTQTKTDKLLSPFRMATDQFPTLFYRNKTKDIFSSTFFPSNTKLIKKIKEINPDIIHLHWINSGFINVFDLQKIKKPIIWSLHDANPYTGGCHVVENGCQFFKTHCHSCPFLGSNFKYDLSFFNFKRKEKAYKNLNLTINGLSRWIANEAKSSLLLGKKEIISLPNTINTNIFRPIDKNIARELIGINKKNKKIIGFGAVSATQVYRKGYLQLKEALEMLPNKEDYILVVFGSSQGESIAGIETHFLGHIYDDLTLRVVYSLFDITLVPSLSESFGQIALESLACGTPVVCFEATGLQDIITHKKDGYLAQPFLASKLAEGILWLSNLDKKEYNNIQNSAIKKAKKFDYSFISEKYINQYKKMLSSIKFKSTPNL